MVLMDDYDPYELARRHYRENVWLRHLLLTRYDSGRRRDLRICQRLYASICSKNRGLISSSISASNSATTPVSSLQARYLS